MSLLRGIPVPQLSPTFKQSRRELVLRADPFATATFMERDAPQAHGVCCEIPIALIDRYESLLPGSTIHNNPPHMVTLSRCSQHGFHEGQMRNGAKGKGGTGPK